MDYAVDYLKKTENKTFKVTIRDSMCDEEDKTYTYTVYVIASDIKQIKEEYLFPSTCVTKWVKNIEEVSSIPKNNTHKVINLVK